MNNKNLDEKEVGLLWLDRESQDRLVELIPKNHPTPQLRGLRRMLLHSEEYNVDIKIVEVRAC